MPNFELTIAQILGLSLTSGVVTFALNSVYSSGVRRSARLVEENHGALKISLSLEKFAIACATSLSQHLDFKSSDRESGQPFSTLPILTFPEQVEWKLLNTKIINQVLAFENMIEYANGYISWSNNYHSPDENNDAPELQAGFCGFEALLLAEQLREIYKLPRRLPASRMWDYVEILKTWHAKMISLPVE